MFLIILLKIFFFFWVLLIFGGLFKDIYKWLGWFFISIFVFFLINVLLVGILIL